MSIVSAYSMGLYSNYMYMEFTNRKSKETNFLISALYLGNDYPEGNLWTVCIKEKVEGGWEREGGKERERERESKCMLSHM